jgi:hypothetical protein
MNTTLRRTFLTTALLALAGCAFQVAPGPGGRGRAAPGWGAPTLRLDPLYRHNHYYPAVGYVAVGLPSGSIAVQFQGVSFYFASGVWYRPSGVRFVVVVPPVGIVVPVLPAAYVTLRFGTGVYYYANGVYYAPAVRGGYVVVAPPPGVEGAQPQAQAAPLPPAPRYEPRFGQSAAQTEADLRECNRWATTQREAVEDADVFRRAVAACMDGRGYTVR